MSPEKDGARESALSDEDLERFREGLHPRLYRILGGHVDPSHPEGGARFAVWAPHARSVSVVGDFNRWEPRAHALRPVKGSGVWEGFVPEAVRGHRYKYSIEAPGKGGVRLEKADPFGFRHEEPPRTASVLWDLSFDWSDDAWMTTRGRRSLRSEPMSIYEVHLGSWRRDPADPGRLRSYRELAPELASHAREMGFTHVELLPVMEHPFYGSWGYQTTGYFAPTSRYGSPQDLMALIDHLHGEGVGVLLDWVPSHFPGDDHGLRRFDGTHLFEYEDPRLGHHPDWDSYVFDYGRRQVRSFLTSSALFWIDAYHVDGLRVDAVASMLYLDYSRKEGEWVPNEYGGRENLEALGFLRRLNEEVYGAHPDVHTIAEESTAWPMVSRPTYVGGLGFGMKWDMGWMNDTLGYLARTPIHRSYHHHELTFRSLYAFNENFVLPLSHDEVVHGKGSLLSRMPGDEWQRRANLRLLFGWMWTQPGKKLLFMGGELGQAREWDHERGLDWHLLEDRRHAGIRRWVRDLNLAYADEPALHSRDFDGAGFQWVEADDSARSVFAFLRWSPEGRVVLVVANCTPEPRPDYRVGVPRAGPWVEILNSDREDYGGSGYGTPAPAAGEPVRHHGWDHSLPLSLPPLSLTVLRGPEPRGADGDGNIPSGGA